MWIQPIKRCGNTTIDMPKIRVYATIREDLVKWLDQEVEKLRFATRSHGLEYALQNLIESEKHKKK